jgi:ribosomal protein L33
MKDELRDELKEKTVNVLNDYIKEIADGRYGIGAYDIVEVADSILSLIDEERCVWTLISNEMGSDFYRTSCGEASFVLNKYCRYCGKRIEVKEVKDGQ